MGEAKSRAQKVEGRTGWLEHVRNDGSVRRHHVSVPCDDRCTVRRSIPPTRVWDEH